MDEEGFSIGEPQDDDIACPHILADAPVESQASCTDVCTSTLPGIKYWIGITFYTRRLHKMGACPYSKRAKNAEFVEELNSADYNCICRHCFKHKAPGDAVSSAEESSSSEERLGEEHV